MTYQAIPCNETKPVNWKSEIVPSSQEMMVYAYDIEENRYKPYKAENVNLGSSYPSQIIDALFEDIHKNTSKPPRVRRVLIGSLV